MKRKCPQCQALFPAKQLTNTAKGYQCCKCDALIKIRFPFLAEVVSGGFAGIALPFFIVLLNFMQWYFAVAVFIGVFIAIIIFEQDYLTMILPIKVKKE